VKACCSCGHAPPKGARLCDQCGSAQADDAALIVMAEAMKARGFHVAPDSTVSAPDLCRFKGWTNDQLRRWRQTGALPKSDRVSKPARYQLRDVVAFIRAGEIF
jgi:hypothetical protein